MKKTYLMALAIGLMAASCGKKAQNMEEPQTAPEEAQGLKIAYVEIDTLMAKYQFCKDYAELANIEGENIQRTLTGKQRTLEQHAAAMQKKYESNGFTSQEELARAQQSLQAEQQALQELSERLQSSFLEEQNKYNEEMRDSVQKFLTVYNKTKKYDFIMAKAGDNMLLANPKYDITDEVLKGLNKRYKIKPEVAEKLKKNEKKDDEKKK
ncbi:MAG: OmpH family outer membrane protein [Bacteroidaceae bacterium]|nr:OmpH family outer membrane protein [Bacteroidaceae bacterium]MBR1788026.1 OmpH family outer membrane protein [Bacteroidaceae bacterium]